jgi:uncharacterized repeat protein (TIGR02543 family)
MNKRMIRGLIPLALALMASLAGCKNPFFAKILAYEEESGGPPPGGYSYTVAFDKNGGDSEADPVSKTVSSPDTTVGTLPAPPSKAGEYFTGWNTQADGSGAAFDASTPVTGDITVYAQWSLTPPSYTVNFSKNGGNSEADPVSKTVSSPDTTVGTLPAPPSKAGEYFAGWNTRADGSGTAFDENTSVTADITVYAQWTLIPYSYTVIFDKNNGDSDANPQSKTVSSPAATVGALPTPPAKAGEYFAGWNTQADGSGTAFDENTPVTADITVYAQWLAYGSGGIALSFNDQGGGTFSEGPFIVSQGGTPPSKIIALMGTWTSREWRVDGVIRGTGTVLTINAADYSLGGHTLAVTVYKNGVPWSKALSFTVIAAVSGVGLNKTTLSLPVNGTETLVPVIIPYGAANKNVSWQSNNITIATVSTGGLVSAKAAGSTTITVTTAEGGFTANCTVTVEPDQGITVGFTDEGTGIFSESSFTVGGTSPIKTITLIGTWASREWRVDGVIRGTGNSLIINAADYSLGGHTLLLTVYKNGVPWSKALNFTVTSVPVSGVGLNKTTLTLPVNGTETLVPLIIPYGAANKNVSWQSNNPAIATVSTGGMVSAKAAGSTTITVTAAEGGFTASCTVTVEPAQGITVGFSDEGTGAFSEGPFTISKGGTPSSKTITLTGTWASQEWQVDGVVRGTGNSLTINAADYSLGGHTLLVTVYKNGVPWSKPLNFTVSN